MRDETSFLRDETPVLRDETPVLRDETPFLRDETSALRDETSVLRDETWLLCDETRSMLITFPKITITTAAIFGILRAVPKHRFPRLHVEPTCPSERRTKMKEFRDVSVLVCGYAANRIRTLRP